MVIPIVSCHAMPYGDNAVNAGIGRRKGFPIIRCCEVYCFVGKGRFINPT
jgi:hypothetical protein